MRVSPGCTARLTAASRVAALPERCRLPLKVRKPPPKDQALDTEPVGVKGGGRASEWHS